MDVRIYIPHPALQEYVLNISTVKAVLPEGITEVVNPYPPTPFQSLLFYCNDPIAMSRNNEDFAIQPLTVLTGPQFSRVNVKVFQRLCAIRVDFLPGGVHRMLGLSMHELFDGGFDALDFFGKELRVVTEQLQSVNNLEECKNLVEKFLVNKVKQVKEILPFDHAVKVLLKNHGNMSIDHAAKLACLSLKQFERKCKESVGMSPKTYARILRFSKAYRMREAFPHISWTKITYEAGYYDQMHLIRDFKIFAGVNPSIIEQQLMSTPLRMQKDLPY